MLQCQSLFLRPDTRSDWVFIGPDPRWVLILRIGYVWD